MKQKATFYIDSEVLENFRINADDGDKKYSELVERMVKAYNEGIDQDFNLVEMFRKIFDFPYIPPENALIFYYPDIAINLWKIDRDTLNILCNEKIVSDYPQAEENPDMTVWNITEMLQVAITNVSRKQLLDYHNFSPDSTLNLFFAEKLGIYEIAKEEESGSFVFTFRHDGDLLKEIVRIMEEELERGYTKTKKVRHINLEDKATIDGTVLIRWNTEALNNIITFFKAIAYE